MTKDRLLQGRYRLLDVIGRGGMGEVWRARDEALGRQVAVKCLKPRGPRQEPGFVTVLRERFRREARAAGGLQHRGITVVHDFGEDEGTLFLVMELLSGRNLSQLMDDNGRRPLPVPDVIDIAEQVAAALAYTHAQAIVHRDLKPANIVRTLDGTVKICDFGIARLGHDIGFTARLTGTGVAMGSPDYMSPEQIGADTVDDRSDLYSLGCVLYEIATGAPPFGSGDAWAVLVGHRDTAPEPPRTHRPELPEPYERIILDLLAKDPDDRPQDADELGKRLADARQVAPGTAPLAGDGGTVARRQPSWTRGMTLGSPAHPVRRPPADPATAVLTDTWTGDKGRREEVSPAAGIPRPVLPDDDPDALTARLEAGLALGGRGRHFEAHQICVAVLAGRERLLGPDHPDTLACRHHLAFGLADLGRLEDCYAMAHEVARARARVLGPRHPDTLVTRYEHAHVMGRLGHWEEALRTYREVAAARAEVFGPAHNDTLAARYETGITLGRLGRSAEALAVYRDVVAARTRAWGADDPETLRARHGLGVNLGRLGRWEEALAEARAVAAARGRVLGGDHPDTLVSRREIAVALGWLGRWAEALGDYRQVADARERVLGPGHLDALASRTDEAQCLEQLGRTDEATALYRRVAALRQERAARR
ncbi:serine/threonine-protein kinase [Streptomyces natalensis]|uniref:non-specific serine/threonine protein kinase n=1 Tax=Streptomyces natalensis ATCC 27448 TaxID=1240678 RepID=A0A0D7CMP5_9ACTN|nr:serine/threonine-protein kinase [Streptomyces natalensis]KIZ17140.1 serine/threonine protein kinase [Streptomyces natalensis ATCC 27448]